MGDSQERIQALEGRCVEADRKVKLPTGAEGREERLKQVLLAVRRVNRAMVRQRTPKDLIDEVCASLKAAMGCTSAWIALLDVDEVCITEMASAGFNGGFAPMRDRLLAGDFPQCMRQALNQDAPIQVADPSSVCLDCPLSSEYGGLVGFTRRLHHDGKLLGIFSVALSQEIAADIEALSLFDELASDVSYALYQMECEAQRMHLQRVVGTIPHPMCFVDRAYHYREVNEAYEKLYAEDRQQIIGRTVAEKLGQAFFEAIVKPHMDRCFAGKTVTYECQVSFPGLPDRTMEMRYYPYRNAGGEVLGLVSHALDITEGKQAEQAIREREAQYQHLLDTLEEGFLRVDSRGYVVRANATSARMFGYDAPEDMAGLHIHDLYANPEQRKDNIEKLKKQRALINVECEARRRDGTTFWTLCNIRLLLDKNDEMAGTEALIRDVTTRKEMDQALRESKERLQLALDGGKLGLWDWETDTGVAAYSSNWAELFGYHPSEVEPTVDFFLSLVHPDDKEEVEQRLARHLAQETPIYESKHQMIHKSGAIMWTLDRGRAVMRDEDGRAVRVTGVITDVTEPESAHERLRREKELLDRIITDGPLCIVILNAEGEVVFCNNQTKLVFGIEPEELHNRTYASPDWQIEGLDGRPLADDEIPFRQVMATGKAIHGAEHSIGLPNGERRIVRVNAAPIFDSQKRIESVVCAVEDMTDQRQAEQELRETAAALEEAQAIARVGTWEHDVMAERPRWSQEMFRLWGLDPEEDEPTWEEHEALIHPEDWPRLNNTVQTALAKGMTGSEEFRILRADGEELWARAEFATESDAEGNVARFLGTVQDITGPKSAEMALRESEERFRSILSDVPMLSVQGYAPDGTTIYWNKGSEVLYGYTEQEALGRNLLDLIIPPEMKPDVAEAMKQMAETGQPIPASELSLMRKDGSRVPVYSSHCILQRAGCPQELYCIDIDLTEMKQAEADRDKLREQLLQAQKMESVGRLAGGVAHDFNNMMNVVLGHADLAIEDLGADHPVCGDLQQIQQAAQRSANLTRQLLGYARRQIITPKALDLNDAVASMLRMLRRLIGENTRLAWRPGGNLHPIRLDPAQLDQILANLVVNAHDAIEGTGEIAITTSMAELDEAFCAANPGANPGTYVVLTVSDDGRGMDAETCERVFEPFFTTKDVGEGSGLGLATVYGIAKQNNAYIDVESQPGAGATFRLFFPAHEAPAKQLRDDDVGAMTAPPGKETILLVEDEPGILEMGRRILQRRGYTVLTASTPTEALAKAARHDQSVDLILTDVIMPEMDGKELAEQVLFLHPNAKRLFMSGYTADVLGPEGAVGEPVDFLPKPFSGNVLSQKVREILDG